MTKQNRIERGMKVRVDKLVEMYSNACGHERLLAEAEMYEEKMWVWLRKELKGLEEKRA